MSRFSVGDHVIYHKSKTSPRPGPRAEDVHAAEHGEDYSYIVDKFWTVSAVIDEETIEVRTRQGKTHCLKTNDPLLRKAGVVDELRFRTRFPEDPESEKPPEEATEQARENRAPDP
jgi:hypothetical protein